MTETRVDADAATTPRCVDCGAPGHPIGLATDAVTLARCATCRLVFNVGWYDGFDDDLYAYYEGHLDQDEDEVYRPLNVQRITALLDDLRDEVGGDRLLDVGCGEGIFVRAGLDAGWRARGLDLADGAIAVAQRHGLPCERLDLFDASLDDQRFDLVVLSEVIEHVPAPTRFLQRCGELLADGGLIYVTTPNFASLGRRVLGTDWREIDPEHLSYFTPRSFRDAARRAGLRTERLTTTNLSMATLRRLRGQAAPRTQTTTHRNDEQACRQQIEDSRRLRVAKDAVNVVLNTTRLGESLKAWLRKA